jgi:hypothetical protein
VVVKDFGYGRVLDRLLMYERRIEHSLYRTMGELQKQRLLRELDPPAARATQEHTATVRGVDMGGERARSPEEVGRGRPTYEDARQTKPIYSERKHRISALRKRSYGKSYMQQAAAKQSQKGLIRFERT